MKKLLMMACLAALVLTGCKDGKTTAGIGAAQSDSLNSIIAQKDSELNDLMGTINEIEDGLNQINEAENRVTLLKNGEGASKKQKLKEDVQFIATRMKQNKELIAKLQKQMANSSIKSEQLQKTIDLLNKKLEAKEKEMQALREELDKQDIHIMELDETINNLNTKSNRLASESSKKSEVINAQDKQINTAWYVFGTKKELKNQHIIEDVNVLTGKFKVMTGNFNKNYFTKIDIRDLSEIKLYSKDVKVLTTHPSSTYTLVRDANKQYTLRITNPQIFWSTSKYLVVLVK